MYIVLEIPLHNSLHKFNKVKVLCNEVVSLQKGRNIQTISQNTKGELNLNSIQSSNYNLFCPNSYAECLTSNLRCLKYEPEILEEKPNSNASNLSYRDSTISNHLPFFEFNHIYPILDENKIGNKEDVSFTSNYLESPSLNVNTHNHSVSFDKYINLDANENLGISNLIFETNTSNSHVEIHKHNTNYDEKYELRDYPSSSFASFNYYQEDIYLDAKLDEIENEFHSICSNFKDQFFKEKLIQTNILKNKKSHAFVHSKEEGDRNQSIPINNKIHTYDVI